MKVWQRKWKYAFAIYKYVFKYVLKYVYSWSRVYILPYKYDTSMFPKKWKWKVYVFGQAHTPPSLASQ